MSLAHKGKTKGHKFNVGKVWIHNIETNELKFINPENGIPEGYALGTNRIPHNKGIPMSNKTKEKISNTKKGLT